METTHTILYVDDEQDNLIIFEQLFKKNNVLIAQIGKIRDAKNPLITTCYQKCHLEQP